MGPSELTVRTRDYGKSFVIGKQKNTYKMDEQRMEDGSTDRG